MSTARRTTTALAALLVAGCSTSTGPKMEGEGELASASAPREREPTQTTKAMMRVSLDETCFKKLWCWKKQREAGEVWVAYFKAVDAMNGTKTLAATTPIRMEAMEGGYSVVCTSPHHGWVCTVKFLGAVLVTAIIPEACTTVVFCVGAVAGAGYAWDSYFSQADQTDGIIVVGRHHSYYTNWEKDEREW